MAFIDIKQPINFQYAKPGTSMSVEITINGYPSNTKSNLTIGAQFGESSYFATPIALTVSGLQRKINGTFVNVTNGSISSDDCTGTYKFNVLVPSINPEKRFFRVFIDNGIKKYSSTHKRLSSQTELDFILKVPTKTDYMVSNIKVEMESTIVDREHLTINVWATNNPYDASPNWEDITDQFNDNKYALLANTNNSIGTQGINIRVKVEKTSDTASINIKSLKLLYY